MVIINNLKKNWKNYLIGLFVLIFISNFLSSGSMMSDSISSFNGEYNEMAYSNKAIAYDRGYGISDSFAPEIEERKVIKNANLALETDNFDLTKTNIISSISAHSVIVLSETQNEYKDNYLNLNYQLKINSNKLDIFLNEVKSYGEVMQMMLLEFTQIIRIEKKGMKIK